MNPRGPESQIELVGMANMVRVNIRIWTDQLSSTTVQSIQRLLEKWDALVTFEWLREMIINSEMIPQAKRIM